MIPEFWQSDRLKFSTFQSSDAKLAKTIYDANAHLRDYDPHFGDHPLSEFQTLIDSDRTGASRDGSTLFFIRCITDIETSRPVGYFQVELDAPGYRQSWLPMFVLRPEAQGLQIGKEAIKALINKVREIGDVDSMGLNVYAENRRALRFWFLCGWREIVGIDLEEVHGRQYTCVTLLQRFA